MLRLRHLTAPRQPVTSDPSLSYGPAALSAQCLVIPQHLCSLSEGLALEQLPHTQNLAAGISQLTRPAGLNCP